MEVGVNHHQGEAAGAILRHLRHSHWPALPPVAIGGIVVQAPPAVTTTDQWCAEKRPLPLRRWAGARSRASVRPSLSCATDLRHRHSAHFFLLFFFPFLFRLFSFSRINNTPATSNFSGDGDPRVNCTDYFSFFSIRVTVESCAWSQIKETVETTKQKKNKKLA